MFDMVKGLYPRHAPGPSTTDVSSSYLVEDLLADAGPVRIDSAVHVEAFPLDGLAEARNVQRLAEEGDRSFLGSIVAYAPAKRQQAERIG